MYVHDSIAAISTPFGVGGIGIGRGSGDLSEQLAINIIRKKKYGGYQSPRFYFGTVFDPATNVDIDDCLLVLMRAPHSYTREDVLEIHCHGGMLVTERILSLVLGLGARLAEPGEFTRRAFLNGRIDLVQAEAVMDIIGAKTDLALQVARGQASGLLSKLFSDVRSHLLFSLALVEAYIDFPEDDIGETDVTSITDSVTKAKTIVSDLISGFNDGKTLRDGISALIIGKPNVGKSSLLNCLLNENRAIVTHVPGTTRDIIEETLNIGGLPVRLLDTAGIRDTDDEVEQEGIKRALSKIPMADMVFFVLDISRPFDDDDQSIFDSLSNSNFFVVLNKSDLDSRLILPPFLSNVPCFSISTSHCTGIQNLKESIRSHFLSSSAIDNRELVALSRQRHRDALVETDRLLTSLIDSISNRIDLELISVDLHSALESIGSVTGHVSNDEMLDMIFSSFCIGK